MLKPRSPIRRFDVFAEYNRLKAMRDGTPPDEAEGYGLWVAKVVASRGFGRGISSHAPSKGGKPVEPEAGEQEAPKEKWHSLDGKPQTDEMFEQEIVRRMGKEFYDTVFSPAIEQALNEDRTYTSIRDTIRRDWKP